MMERNREARRASMAAAPNGLSRRRHRSSSLRDSPDEDGPVEMAEPAARLRDRGLKKDRDRDRDRERDRDMDRDRDRERDRDRSSRSKRRRENRMMHGGGGIREDGGEDTSEESVNDEEDEDVDDGGGVLRMLPPANPAAAATAAAAMNNHHVHPLHRKNFPPSGNKLLKAATVAAPAWKTADEMIGVPVPRKARSASTKRGHDWISGGGAVGAEPIHRQSSSSPVRLTSAASPVGAGPVSPSSSNVSIRKKMKPNGGGAAKPRPPKSSSKSSSSNPEELEIEIAEVLYGLMTQSQAPSKKEIVSNDSAKLDSNKSSSDAKSRVSSPISNSTPSVAPPHNSCSSSVPLSAVAPKRKRPRQVSDFGVRSSPGSSMKTEIDHQSPKTEVSSPNLENSGSAVENGGVSFDFSNLGNHSQVLPVESLAPVESKPLMEDGVLTKEEASSPRKESSAIRLADNISEVVIATGSSTVTKLSPGVSAIESRREEKFQIDLMVAPPQLRSSPDREDMINFAEHERMSSLVDAEMRQMMKDKEADRLGKIGKKEPGNVAEKAEEKRSKAFVEAVEETQKPILNKGRNIDLQLDLEKADRDSHGVGGNKSQHQVARHHQQPHKTTKDEPNTEKNAHASSLPLPMSIASWPSGLPSMGYVAPMQGVVSMDGNGMPATPVQPIFSQPRPKRCATHCYIARNIHYLQQFMKMNPFWPAAASTPPLFGAKPGNLNLMPSPELNGNIVARSLNSLQDKGQSLAFFPSQSVKDKSSQAPTIPDPAQRKQHISLQQALPPVGPNNILHGPAFIFPFNQQQAASVRPGSNKSLAPATGSSAVSSASVSAPPTAAPPMSFVGPSATTPPNPMSFMGATATGPTAMSFNYPNMSPNETQYLAILQNNPYPFPIPAVGGPPNYRGSPHAQAMPPLFNGSFYSSQMIHPSQLQQQQQQQQQPSPAPSQPQQATHQKTSSGGSSSSQKHLQMQQQRQQGNAINASKVRSSQQTQQQNQHVPTPQARIHENEVAAEDTPSTADSRTSRAPSMSIYGQQNFALPIHPQNFPLLTPPTFLANASDSSNEKKQSQQQGSKNSVDSHPPQAFAMTFAPMNGSGATTAIDISSMAHNHAIFQSLPESMRQNYHQIMAHQQAQQKKNFRMSEEAKTGGGSDLSNTDEDRKGGGGSAGKSGQSIAFSRPEVTDASHRPSAVPGNTVIDSSARNQNLASTPAQTVRSPISNTVGTSSTSQQQLHHVQLHQQQQHLIQLQKQHQQHIQNQHQLASSLARSKNPPTSNGSAYSEHLLSTSSSVNAKFPNSLSSFPQNLVQTSNSSGSPSQSPQWKNPSRAPTSQVPSTTSALKNHSQPQQTARAHQQSHTQISFGANQKTSNPSQGQQPSNSNNNQCPSPPMVVGSPTTSSISKGASGSPRTNASASTSNKNGQASSLSSQQAKNSAVGPSQRPSPSILGNPHITTTSGAKSQQQQQQQQQQLSKQTMQQQAHLFFSNNPYMQQAQAQAQAQAHAQAQAQAQAHAQHSGTSAASASGYYLQRRREQSQQPPGSSSTSTTGMLSMSSPVNLPSGTTSDPAKAMAAAASNMKGGGLPSQGILHAPQFVTQSSGNAHQLIPAGFSYLHPVPAAVQVKPVEQKQPAGNDNLHACWQPDKK